ncbi:MAG TPA: TatD family hydrolase [Candidatus Obscuribacter sp.]|nr:TatD family hydrolase [Candidatus Obscuribacter sp.]HMY52403.1 TatD family hydrolase [Candidatus Obscuribacter sp.]HNA74953.1 TatD family hydrolase [Candidatus Obscuribacter sp.]HND07109.1 TatD family hydrolase [Candidatus Obscuribacter sp.]HND67504.1 TatD family hydrolase [Candidatus Obscuribacter sp.]
MSSESEKSQVKKAEKKREAPPPPNVAGGIIDSHAHVVEEFFQEEKGAIIDRARNLGVKRLVNPAVTLKESELAELKRLTETYDFIYAGCGLHPHEAKDWTEESADLIKERLKLPKYVAVGECGLDYYYNNSSREEQVLAFSEQIKLALLLNKPLIVHCRDAWQEAFDLISLHGKGQVRGVFHCFTGGPEHLEAIKALDFYVSFSGIVTYKNAEGIQEAARLVSNDRFLVETDCPFLSPQKVRGIRNEPSFVWWTAEKLCQLRNTDMEEISQLASENATRLFSLN